MRRISKYHIFILVILAVVAFNFSRAAGKKDGLLKVYFLDVGQGDAMFVEAPNGNQVLIDGGPDGKVLAELGKIMPFFDRDIDLVSISHPQSDHLSGALEVLDRYEVGQILESSISYDSALFSAWQGKKRTEGARQLWALAGEVLDLGSGVRLEVLGPKSGLKLAKSDINNDSVVIRLVYKDFEVLFTGDTEKKGELVILNQNKNISADVLKVGHHGSKTSTTASFLNAINPQVAVIEVGAKNRYGHPTKEVLDRLDNSGIKYYRTDTDGGIKISSDGNKFFVTKY